MPHHKLVLKIFPELWLRPEEIESEINFTKTNLWPPEWPEPLLRRFLSDLISSSNQVLHLDCDGKQVGLAVALDKVSNLGNLVNLEILGISGSPSEEVVDFILQKAKERVPSDRTGFVFGLEEGNPLIPTIQARRDLEFYYESCEMLRMLDGPIYAPASEVAQTSDVDEVYHLLVASFSENPETSIPDLESYKRSRTANSLTLIERQDGRIVGFLNLVLDSFASVNTLGVAHSHRGKGIGRRLLLSALQHAQAQGRTHCELAVAVQNVGALKIYQDLGFCVTRKYISYRWTKP